MTSSSLYPVFGTGLVLILVFLNYVRKTDTDKFQRKIYLSVLIAVFISIVANFAASVLDGRPGGAVHILLLIINNIYFIFQNLSYYLVVVFIDYLANKNSARVRKFVYIVLGIMAVNAVVMVLNISYGFYFSISADNRFTNGTMSLVRFYLGYTAIVMAIVDLFLSARFLKSMHVYIIILFAVLVGAGAALDLIFPGGNIIWAFLTAGMLHGYFYILKSDTTQDNITGIGNRSSFNEFINQLIRMKEKQSYVIAQFDINGLKKINDKHGIEGGDKALSDLAMILQKCSRQSDFVARIGDDEFIVAMKEKYIKSEYDDKSRLNIDIMLYRFLKTLEDYNNRADKTFDLSISYGYDTYVTKTDQLIEEFLQGLSRKVFQHKQDQRSSEAATHA
ncbi:MAG: GGDEF domain-containing protein [Treponema sp.]|jgi:diguanylate cyclase (GGDEF)-like protein|nr:GGDEF domain-containing protein [Treponema sp.]